MEDKPFNESVYFTIQIRKFNITELSYSQTAENTNIFLIESLENMKYYISNFEFRGEFELVANFSGLLDDDS